MNLHPVFSLFSSLHGAILASVLLAAAGLVWISTKAVSPKLIRCLLASGIALSELLWYGYCIRQGWARFPDVLPLQLCDLTLWMTVAVLLAPRAWLYDITYYWALGGTGMALLTPDVGGNGPLYPVLQFFIAHGAVVVGNLYLAWAKILRPRASSAWRAWSTLNMYAAVIAVFNRLFSSNYLYLCRKPDNPSPLDFLGPWPIYILTSDLLALGIFWALSLPYRERS